MEFIDEYNHEIPGVIYFPRSLPCREIQQRFDYNIRGCRCEEECLGSTKCSCIRGSGSIYKYDDKNDIQNYTIQANNSRSPIYECNENCSCSKRACGNRLIQYGPRKDLEVRPCENKGLGLFTTREIKKGNFVCEYAGEIIEENEALTRFKINTERNKTNYIFCIKEHFKEIVETTFIDPTHYGNIGRYINHSCEPNCKLNIIRINDDLPILAIFASENIAPNEEITYDYGEGTPGLENHEKHTWKKCYCNSETCRKYLPFDVSLFPE